MPDDRHWRLVRFLPEFDAWCARERVDRDVRIVVLDWIMSRMEDPYRGVRRADGFANLWYGRIPEAQDTATGRQVTCSYWIDERERTVRLDNFGLR